MSNLTGSTISDTYGGVINIGPSGATGSLQSLTDGFGTTLPIQVSTTEINFTGTVTGISGTSGTSGISGSSGTSGSSSPSYYLSAYDTTDQTNAGATAANIITYNTTDFSSGISIVSNSQITISNTGKYNIQFSAQFQKSSGGDNTVDIWLKKNGSNVANSNTRLTLAGNPGYVVAAWNLLVDATGGDYYELAWSSADTTMELHADSAGVDPTRPAIPSIILSVVPV